MSTVPPPPNSSTPWRSATPEERAELYRLFSEKTSEGIFLLESEGPDVGRIVEVNAAAARMHGYTVEELLTMKITDLDVLENVARAPDRFHKVLEGDWIEGRVMHLRRDGSLFPIEFSAGPIHLRGKTYTLAFTRDISRHIQAEQEAVEAKNFLQSIIESIADPIFVKDREHRWVMLNDAFCTFMGHPRTALIDKSDYEFFPKEQADVFWEKDELVFSTGQENVNEEQFTDAKGVIHTIVTKKNIMADRHGNPLLVGIIRDITDRVQSERDAQRLAAIVESSHDAIYAKSLEGTIMSWNQGAEKMFGYTAQEAIGQNITLLTPPQRRGEVQRVLEKVGHGEHITQLETMRRRKDGTMIAVSLTVSPIRDAHGTVTGASTIARDISVFKKIENDLLATKQRLMEEAENAQKFLLAVEASSIATVITTTAPNILYVNPAWEKLTGYTKAEVMEKNPRVLKSGKTPAALYPRLWETIMENREFATEDIVNRRKDGTEYNAELRIFPIVKNGAVQFFVGLQTDITLRKRSEAAKSEFMSLASHQLRTPLTGLRWGIAMLKKKGPLNPQQIDIMDELQHATARMAESINVMLHLSRIESGKVEVKRAPIVLQDFIKNICATFLSQAQEKQQQCALQCDEPIVLQSDEELLYEILTNLLTNAIKYTPPGGKIELNVKRIGEDVRLSVRDSGLGIPVDQQSKIFSKFFRATNVTDKIPDGTGLGLYLVYTLTTLLGGTITFASQENIGTTFTLTLPLVPTVSPSSPSPSPLPLPQTPSPSMP